MWRKNDKYDVCPQVAVLVTCMHLRTTPNPPNGKQKSEFSTGKRDVSNDLPTNMEKKFLDM